MKELKAGISGVVKKSHEENGITVIDEFIPDGASILTDGLVIETDEEGQGRTAHPDAPLTIDNVRKLQGALARADVEEET